MGAKLVASPPLEREPGTHGRRGHHQPATTSRPRPGLVAEGLANDEIAVRVVISPATARTQISQTMIKLAARDRAQLVVFAYQSGVMT